MLVVRRQCLQLQPWAIYCLSGGMLEIGVHLNVYLNAKSAPLVLNDLRLERQLLIFRGVSEFPQHVHTSEEHLRFAHPESKVVVEGMDGATILQHFNNRITVKEIFLNRLNRKSRVLSCAMLGALTMGAPGFRHARVFRTSFFATHRTNP